MSDEPPDPPDVNELADDHLRRIGEALSRRGRSSLRRAVVVNGIRVALIAERSRRQPAEDFGALPETVADLPRADKRVYALIRDTRVAPGGAAAVLNSAEIERAIRAAAPNDDLDITTVRHALKRLRDAGAVWKHPERGYDLGAGQPALPFGAGQSDALPAPPAAG